MYLLGIKLVLDSLFPSFCTLKMNVCFILTYFQGKFQVLTDPGALAINNHLAMMGLPVPGVPLVTPVAQVVSVPELPKLDSSLWLLSCVMILL